MRHYSLLFLGRALRCHWSLFLLLTCSAGLFLPSCRMPDEQYATALHGHWQLIKPYAEAGLAADDTITDESRELRMRTIAAFDALLEEGLPRE